MTTQPPLTCPGGDEPCEFSTADRTRGRDGTMGRHIQTTHPRRYRTGDCKTCDYRRSPGGSERATPPHDASFRCESGWYAHCSCGTCF